MYQNYLKVIEHLEIRNLCYGYQNLRPRCHLQGETPIEISVTFIHDLSTFWVDLMCNIDNLQILQAISVVQNQSEWHGKTGQLHTLDSVNDESFLPLVQTTTCGKQPLYFH